MLQRVMRVGIICGTAPNLNSLQMTRFSITRHQHYCTTPVNPFSAACSPKVYTEYNDIVNTEVYVKPSRRLNNYNVKGWTRFMMGTGRDSL